MLDQREVEAFQKYQDTRSMYDLVKIARVKQLKTGMSLRGCINCWLDYACIMRIPPTEDMHLFETLKFKKD